MLPQWQALWLLLLTQQVGVAWLDAALKPHTSRILNQVSPTGRKQVVSGWGEAQLSLRGAGEGNEAAAWADWKVEEIGVREEGDEEDEDDDTADPKSLQYTKLTVPPRQGRPDRPPDVLAASAWDCLFPSGPSPRHLTLRLGKGHGTIVQMRVDSKGSARFAPAGRRGPVYEWSAAGEVFVVGGEKLNSTVPAQLACQKCESKEPLQDADATAAGSKREGWMRVGGKGEVKQRGDSLCEECEQEWLNNWEDAELVRQAESMEGKMLLKDLPFEVDERGDKVPRFKFGRWFMERVWPGENVCILNIDTQGLQVWLADDGLVLFGGEEGKGTVGKWGEGNCLRVRNGGWKEQDPDVARSEVQKMVFKGMAAFRGTGKPGPPAGIEEAGTGSTVSDGRRKQRSNKSGRAEIDALRGGAGGSNMHSLQALRGGQEEDADDEVEFVSDDGLSQDDPRVIRGIVGAATRRDEDEFDKAEKMSFDALTKKLQQISGVKPTPGNYGQALWPEPRPLPGSRDLLNIHLWEASVLGHHRNLSDIVGQGADVHARDESRGEWTAMHYAATGADWIFVGCNDSEQARTVRKLSELGADVNANNSFGWTPLHAAAMRGHLTTVTRLVSLGARVNVRESRGFTPLHMAARWGRKAVVQRLMDLGGDVRARDKANMTALDHAWYFLDQDCGEDMKGTLDLLKDTVGETAELRAAVIRNPDDSKQLAEGVGVSGARARAARDEVQNENVPQEQEESVEEDDRRSGEGEMHEVPLDELSVPEGDIPFWDTDGWNRRLEEYKQKLESKAKGTLGGKALNESDVNPKLVQTDCSEAAKKRGRDTNMFSQQEYARELLREKLEEEKAWGRGAETWVNPRGPTGYFNDDEDDDEDEFELLRQAHENEQEAKRAKVREMQSNIPFEFRGGELVQQIYKE